jgi:hypothetical protein
MSESPPEILILDRRIEPTELTRLVEISFGDMVKYVMDIERRIAAVGGQLHADEAIRERVRDVTWALIGRGEPLS